MQQHTVQIAFKAEGDPVPLSAGGKTIQMICVVEKGDQICWTSYQGTVEVVFQDGTPFADGVKGDGNLRAIAAEKGTFHYNCTVTTPDGQKHGWPKNTKGGGTVEVGGGRTGTP